ncbi:MAG: CDP-diacylglycerol--serine O-phosphatidyltransferase [Rikenellaceae bacterium]|nr:CDP-diacylglycerol--serine O-phosphatidyltransferase [Rikenellaceae bacterium]
MKQIIKSIPNLLPLSNLFCGCVAVAYAFWGDFATTFWLVVLASVFDFMDGMAARLLNAHSPIGADLDSLADMVSFGVAPSVVLFSLGVGWFGFVVALFSALRLAKFNVDDRQTTEFIGLPVPADALFFTSIGYIVYDGSSTYLAVVFSTVWFLSALAALFSLLMVSEIRMFSLKFKSLRLKDNALRYCFLALSAVAVALFGIKAVPFAIVGYIALSMTRNLVSSTKLA